MTTEYVLNGSQVMRQIISDGTTTYVADYIYHENGIPLGFAYYQENGTPVYYFYETNLQGDVVAIYDANGNKVVGFRYDAWGNFTENVVNSTVCTTEFLAASLFRYRSYIYDYESGLYYLQSRYYDPQTGRFLNADKYVNANGDLLGYNMYAYCSNNPVMYSDPTGEIVTEIIAVLVITALIIATANDIYQIASGNVSMIKPKNTGGTPKSSTVEIKDSYKILTPWVQYGYSVYLNHFDSYSKDIIKGASTGVLYEWQLHNVAFVWYKVTGENSKADRAGSVNVGGTIFSDTTPGLSILMKGMYMSCGILVWAYDYMVERNQKNEKTN